MSFGASIKYCLRHPFTFKGRARRSEFWWYVLFIEIISLVLAAVLTALVLAAGRSLVAGTDPTTGQKDDDDVITWMMTVVVVTGLVTLFSVILQLFLLGANARRLHDVDQSAHWLWFYLVGLAIVPLVMGIAEGTVGPNRFGPDPKELPALGSADVAGA